MGEGKGGKGVRLRDIEGTSVLRPWCARDPCGETPDPPENAALHQQTKTKKALQQREKKKTEEGGKRVVASERGRFLCHCCGRPRHGEDHGDPPGEQEEKRETICQ